MIWTRVDSGDGALEEEKKKFGERKIKMGIPVTLNQANCHYCLNCVFNYFRALNLRSLLLSNRSGYVRGCMSRFRMDATSPVMHIEDWPTEITRYWIRHISTSVIEISREIHSGAVPV